MSNSKLTTIIGLIVFIIGTVLEYISHHGTLNADLARLLSTIGVTLTAFGRPLLSSGDNNVGPKE